MGVATGFRTSIPSGSTREIMLKQELANLRAARHQRELRYVPARIPAQDPRDWDDQTGQQRHHDGAPQDLQAGAVEDDLAPRAGDIAADPAHPEDDHPGPANDGDGGEEGQELPADIADHAAIEGKRQ